VKFRLVSLALALVFPLFILHPLAQLDDDPNLDERVQSFARQVRCLVCQNETLADSRAELATDLKREIREQMKIGRSDGEILAFLTERYGDFVWYRPPLKPRTYLLWFGPFGFLTGGLLTLYHYVRQRSAQGNVRSLSVTERKRARKLLHLDDRQESA
jgi:cytochrome c-type biogenesis protein CcmH